MFWLLFVALWGCAIVERRVEGHTYHLGACPNIDPMPEFNMKRLLGVWYAVQKTSTASTCITYNFTKTEEPDEYELEQTSQHFVLGLTPLEHQYKYTGRLTVPDASVPARMTAKFPLNFAGSATYTVFMTDYVNYAAIFTCQKLSFAHRQSATILSRERTLDKMFIDKIRTRLSSYNIDPFDLSIISQKNCPKNINGTQGVNIDIDDDTFSAHSIAGVVKKAGEKIGDGIEYVAGGAKKVYNRYAKDGEEAADDAKKVYNRYSKDGQEAIEDAKEKARRMSAHPDAEWLP